MNLVKQSGTEASGEFEFDDINALGGSLGKDSFERSDWIALRRCVRSSRGEVRLLSMWARIIA